MPSGTSRQEGGIGLKIARSLFFLPFLAIGVWFASIIVYYTVRAILTYTWPETSCRVVWSGVEVPPASKPDEAYQFKVVYQYDVAGRRLAGDRYKPGYGGSERTEAAELLAKYPRGSRVPCYYNPRDVSSVTLERSNPLPGFFIVLFPLLFVFAGGYGLYTLWGRGGSLS